MRNGDSELEGLGWWGMGEGTATIRDGGNEQERTRDRSEI
jgi:hypothetical protein